MHLHTDVFITKSSDSKDFYFSDLQVCKFNQLIFSMLYDAFLNNYNHWFTFEKPADLDFTITIKTNWSKDPLLLEVFKKLRDLELQEKHLWPTLNRISNMYYKEDQRKLEHDNIKTFYATAVFENNEREKLDFLDEEKRIAEFKKSNKLKEIEKIYRKKSEPIKKKVKKLKEKENSI